MVITALAALRSQSPTGPHGFRASLGYPDFGSIVGLAGDVDGDGVPDLVLGDPGDGIESVHAAFWIASGRDGTVLRRLQLPEPAMAEYGLGGGIDFDGDHVPDLLIEVQPIFAAEYGYVDLVSGKDGSVVRQFDFCGNPVGPGWQHNTGHWTTVVADLDHDGAPGIAVLRTRTSAGSGTIFLLSGRSGLKIGAIPVENSGDLECGTLSQIGDADGDGVSDLAVLLFGETRTPASLRVYSVAKKKLIWERPSPQGNGGAYGGFALADDRQRKGVHAFAVSFFDRVDVFERESGGAFYDLEMKDPTDSQTGFGWALATLGDIDGDGVVDFAVSETESWMSNGFVYAKSGRDGQTLWRVPNGFDDTLFHLGHELVAVGDLDGDSVTDLLAGTWEGEAGEPGRARVLSGKSGATLFDFRRNGDDLAVTKWSRAAEQGR